ncbi:hypothetical protein M8J75_010988 [Diaphorina citri]|nr:hypothetical protein M8J75_010988 [Diaphorina citri]KAI5727678.1 hypothetical protein M8J77_005579 [Diaphorina citri]
MSDLQVGQRFRRWFRSFIEPCTSDLGELVITKRCELDLLEFFHEDLYCILRFEAMTRTARAMYGNTSRGEVAKLLPQSPQRVQGQGVDLWALDLVLGELDLSLGT